MGAETTTMTDLLNSSAFPRSTRYDSVRIGVLERSKIDHESSSESGEATALSWAKKT